MFFYYSRVLPRQRSFVSSTKWTWYQFY